LKIELISIATPQKRHIKTRLKNYLIIINPTTTSSKESYFKHEPYNNKIIESKIKQTKPTTSSKYKTI